MVIMLWVGDLQGQITFFPVLDLVPKMRILAPVSCFANVTWNLKNNIGRKLVIKLMGNWEAA